MNILAFKIEAFAQSWSTDNNILKIKDSQDFITKSGFSGMIGLAMGLDRTEVPQYVSDIEFGVRKDATGERVVDFQTTKLLYKDDIYFQADSKVTNKATFVEHNTYLFNYTYTVCISGSIEKLTAIQEAFRHPKNTVFLGRKNCLPSSPIRGELHTEFDSIKDALVGLPITNKKDKYILYLYDDVNGRERINDIPIDFTTQTYGIRKATLDRFKNPNTTI